MPIIKSAKKRVRTAEKAAVRNSKTKRILKSALKAFRRDIANGASTTESHAEAQSNVDVAAKKGLIHKNKADRQKAQLAKIAKDAAAATGTKAPAKKSVAKKPAAVKKPVAAKKPAPAKPATVKKLAAKKPAAAKKSAAKTAAKTPTAKK